MSTTPVTFQERIPLPPAAAARASAPAAAGITLSDVLRILKQRAFLIIFVWVLLTGATGGLTYWLIQNRPSYRAAALLEVQSPMQKDPLQISAPMVQVEIMERFVSDKVALLQQETLLREVLSKDAITTDDPTNRLRWYHDEPDKVKLLEDFKSSLNVGNLPNTNLVVVSMSTRWPQDSAVIVNTLVDVFLDQQKRQNLQEYAGEFDKMEDQQKRLAAEAKRNQDERNEFLVNKFSSPGVASGVNVLAESWRALTNEVTRVSAEKLQYKAQYDNLIKVEADQLSISPLSEQLIQQDPQVVALQNQKLGLEQTLMETLLRVGENHRAVQDLRSSIEVVNDQLDRIVQARRQEVRDYQRDSARTLLLNAAQAEAQLREEASAAELRQRDLDGQIAKYRALEEEYISIENQLREVGEHMGRLRVLRTDEDRLARVVQRSSAYPPPKRSFPRWELNMPLGSFLGLALGIGLAILLEVVDTSIRTPRDLTRHVHVPILGTVPDLDDEEVTIDKVEIATHTHQQSLVAEAFRSIRTNLLLSSPAERQRAVLITSAKPEEGRTSVACNLAISLGQSGRRVLLVDANFHRPMLPEVFPKIRREGLSNVLVGQSALGDLITPSGLPNVDLLSTGPIPPNPAELLSGNYFRDLIEQATRLYDQVLFDGPPLLLVSDGLVIAGAVDGVVLVVRAKSTSRGVVMRAREQLERVHARMFGAVLNAARIARGGYYREQIRSFYDYKTEPALAAEFTKALPGDKKDQGGEDKKS